MSKFPFFIRVAAAAAVALAAPAWADDPQAPGVRLYTLDCGRAEFRDFGIASDTGDYDGRPAQLADPCFLVKHPAGWMLWDAGLPAELPDVLTQGVPPAQRMEKLGFRTWVTTSLQDQLKALGLAPGDIRYIAFSHMHFDHVGNANLFTGSTWILQRAELQWALAEPPPVSMVPQLFAGRASARRRVIDGDFDVFGDGAVRILRAPGHTPGSSVLLVRLEHGGYVLLSGDLYVSLEGRAHAHVPAVNSDRAATLASMARVEAIVKRLGARLIVQHAPEDFERLPRPPAYLD